MLLNHHISAAVRAISTKFGMVTQFDPLTVPNVKKFKFWKSHMAAVAILKIEKSPYFGRSSS